MTRSALTLTLAAATLAPAFVRAQPIVAVTSNNFLVSFGGSTPNTLNSQVSVTGLQSGDSLVGIDFRPATSQVYGLAANGTTGRLYVLNQATGVATLASTLSAPLSGSFYGVDFNPVLDRLRVVSDTGQNLSIDVSTGTVTTQTALGYLAGDPNAGSPPQVVASAYTNNFPGAGLTTLYGIDVGLNTLVIQNPPPSGNLSTVGLLSLQATADTAFDIAMNATAYAVLDGINLSTINLSTGNVVQVGAIAAPGFVIDITAVPEPGSFLLVAVVTGGLAARRLRRRSPMA